MAKAEISLKGYRMTGLDVIVPDMEFGRTGENREMLVQTGSNVTGCADVDMSDSQKETVPVLWLLHDSGGKGADFLRYTALEAYCRQRRLYVVCVTTEDGDYQNHPGEDHADWADYVTDYLWDVVQQMFPAASECAGDNYIAGTGVGAGGAMNLCREHPEKYADSFMLPDEWESIGVKLREIVEKISK